MGIQSTKPVSLAYHLRHDVSGRVLSRSARQGGPQQAGVLLFDVRSDTMEKHNVAADNPQVVERLIAELNAVLLPKHRDATAVNPSVNPGAHADMFTSVVLYRFMVYVSPLFMLYFSTAFLSVLYTLTCREDRFSR